MPDLLNVSPRIGIPLAETDPSSQSLQDLNECRVTKLNNIWTRSASLETECHQRCTEHLESVISDIKRNLPYLDSNMFVEHNVAAWNEPANFDFEPSMVWHDTDEIVVDEPAQVFLRNMMTKSRRSLDEVKPDWEKKRKEIEILKVRKEEVKIDETQGQLDADVARVCLRTYDDPHFRNLLGNIGFVQHHGGICSF